MKRSILSLLTFGLLGVCDAAPLNPAHLADCIAQVEGASTTTIGKNGERSRWQFTQAVWDQHSLYNFQRASSTDPKFLAEQYAVAIKHIAWLQKNVERPTVYRLAAAWNGGATAVNAGKFTPGMVSYAERVRNLYNATNDNEP